MQKQRRTATAQLFQLRRRHRPRIRAHRKSGATIHSVCPRHRMRLDKANEAPLHTEIRKRATGSLGRDSPKRRSADMRLSHANIREGCDVPSRLDRRKIASQRTTVMTVSHCRIRSQSGVTVCIHVRALVAMCSEIADIEGTVSVSHDQFFVLRLDCLRRFCTRCGAFPPARSSKSADSAHL